MRTNEGNIFFPSESPDVEEFWRQKEEKKKKPNQTLRLHSFCFAATFATKSAKMKSRLARSHANSWKSSVVYLSRPLTSKVFAKGPESPRHGGDIKRWQRWRPSTGPFSQRIMEPGDTETHGAFFRCARPLGLLPSVVSLNGPSAARFLKFDKVLFAFVCSEPRLPFSVFLLVFCCCFLSSSSVFYTIFCGDINHGAVPQSHLSRQKLHSHYVNSLPTISHKERGLRVMCTTPAGVDKH